jgi:hypothetical protein
MPFHLAKGPLVRARLLRMAADDHLLMFTMHHITTDAWSAGILFQELAAIYEAFATGRPSPLADPELQFADYAAHERQWLSGEVLQDKLAWWKAQLRGAPEAISLPGGRPRPIKRSGRGAKEAVAIDSDLARALKAIASESGASLYMTLLAGFQTLLSKYTGGQKIVLGLDSANRGTSETERMVGFFVNLLPVAFDVSGNPTFRELLERVRDRLLECYAYQDVPFDRLVEELNPRRTGAYHPIVQVLFVMQNVPRTERKLHGLDLLPFEAPIATSKFDLAVFVEERTDELIAHWVYSTDLYASGIVRTWARHLDTLLRNAVARPNERLSAIDTLTAEEKLQQENDRKARKQKRAGKLTVGAPVPVDLSQAPGGGGN